MWRILPITWILNFPRFEEPVLTSSQILHQQLAIWQIVTFTEICFPPQCHGLWQTYSHEPTYLAYQVKHTGNQLGRMRGKQEVSRQRIKRWRCWREDGRQKQRDKMRHNNHPVWMKVGVEDRHLRRWHNKKICENQLAKERQMRQKTDVSRLERYYTNILLARLTKVRL